MSTHKHFDRICLIVCLLAVVVTVLFMSGAALGITAVSRPMGYEARLFDTGRVHTIDIIMDDWDGFIDGCEDEEYVLCSLVIDGEAHQNVGIRAKGNTSLSSVSSMDSDRYSFKVEFDQYDSTKSYYGLDKLSLNNLIQDNTMMKDFLVYQMMEAFGVDAPLCSYIYLTVNGEDWGLYLAVEGVEDSFLQRNYGSDHGELYKPDSMSFGGGRGNGKDFDMGNFSFEDSEIPQQLSMGQDGFDPSAMGGQRPGGNKGGGRGQQGGAFPSEGMGGFDGNMGGSDVKLQYIDDDPDSYANIFDNAKTDITAADQARLIRSLKTLSEYSDIDSVVNVDEVLRYFVVHNFVVNGDSYTGSMIHNYYLYEKDGQLSMIPWDYNLAFGTFQSANASSSVNQTIDDGATLSDRPMAHWIFSSEEYTELYHQYYRQFAETCLDSGWLTDLIDTTAKLIAPYVEKDPTRFCTFEEFEVGVAAIRQFCLLRAESVSAQLAGNDAAIDTGTLNISDIGTMGDTMGGGRGEMPNMGEIPSDGQTPPGGTFPGGQQMPGGGQPPTPPSN